MSNEEAFKKVVEAYVSALQPKKVNCQCKGGEVFNGHDWGDCHYCKGTGKKNAIRLNAGRFAKAVEEIVFNSDEFESYEPKEQA